MSDVCVCEGDFTWWAASGEILLVVDAHSEFERDPIDLIILESLRAGILMLPVAVASYAVMCVI